MSENKTHAQELAKTFVYLDFYYQYSDDSRAYNAGRESTSKFREDYTKLTDEEKKEFYLELKDLGKIESVKDQFSYYKIEVYED